jgi:hypothetical protein
MAETTALFPPSPMTVAAPWSLRMAGNCFYIVPLDRTKIVDIVFVDIGRYK